MTGNRHTTLGSIRHSLRWRLPVLITALVGVVVALVVTLAYRAIARADVMLAAGRAQGAVTQIASSLAQSTQQRMREGQQFVAGAPELLECLRTGAVSSCASARDALASLPATAPQVAELWSANGVRVLTAASQPGADRLLPSAGAPAAQGVQPLRAHGGMLFGETVWPVDPGAGADGPPAGFVVIRRPISSAAQTRDLLNQLLGDQGSITVGNRQGDVWTNLAAAAPAPPIDLNRPGIQTYADASGELHVGALAPIRGTPWVTWAEFPGQAILATARQLLLRMSFLAMLFVSGACAVAIVISRRITAPLGRLTEMSEAVAQGDYSRRIGSTRLDEVGRLGRAFDVMVDGVQEAYRNLEQTVQERTEGLQAVRRELECRVVELKHAREEQERFFALSPDLLCIADTAGRLLKVNDAWERLLGWSAHDLTAAPYIDFVHPDDVTATVQATEALSRQQQAVRLENRYRRSDGSYVWLSWRAVSHPERGVVYAAARDITERRRIARELEQHAEEVAAVNRELEAFTYSVSHDLRAPLRHITGFATLLVRSASAKLDEQERRWLSVVSDGGLRMGRLIDDLLAFSRVGRTAVSLERVDLTAVVRDAWLEAVPPDTDTRRIECVIRPLPEVVGDAALLRLAFVNLLANAVKYTRNVAAPRIEVAAATGAGGETVVSVRDNGVGFDMQFAHKLFGVFQRLHSSDEFEGTGIGLANVRRIVHRHGGRTWAEGAVGQGATFFVALPVPLIEAA